MSTETPRRTTKIDDIELIEVFDSEVENLTEEAMRVVVSFPGLPTIVFVREKDLPHPEKLLVRKLVQDSYSELGLRGKMSEADRTTLIQHVIDTLRVEGWKEPTSG